MLTGRFHNERGQEVTWEVLEVHDYDGEVHAGGEAEDSLDEADTVFYSLEIEGEMFFRYIHGPFPGGMDMVQSAIEDETSVYEGM